VNLYVQDRLLFTTVELEHSGKNLTIDRVLVDTGSAGTLFQTELVEQLGLIYEPNDEVHEVFGVGGSEFVFQKRVNRIACSSYSTTGFQIEVGWLNYGIRLNGILGLDFLLTTRATLDLGRLKV
jgi:hypothetical protein